MSLDRWPGELSAQKRALLEQLLREEQAEPRAAGRIPRRPPNGVAPQSFAQRRIWLFEQLRPGTPLFTIRTTVRLSGGVDHAALTRSLGELVRRHESLRTTFGTCDGIPIQAIAPAVPAPLPIVEISGDTPREREEAARRRMDDEASRGFDLERGPLFRAHLLRLEPSDHLLLLTMHHIVADGWSLGILLDELSTLYAAFVRGAPSPLPEPEIQYADYAHWQHETASGGAFRDGLEYWTKQVADLPPLTLRTERDRPATPALTGERQHAMLSPEATADLVALAQREGATLFMTLLAAFQVVLARWSGAEDFGIGTPIASRTRAETERVVGFFLNTLVLRADLTGDPAFRDLLGRIRETTLQAYAHQEVPFEQLLETLRVPRDANRTPLFQTFFNLLNFSDERLNRPVVLADAPPEADVAQFDLTLYAGEYHGRLQLQLVYRADLFATATAARFLGHLRTLLEHLPRHANDRISALPIVPPEERARLSARRAAGRSHAEAEPFVREAIEQSIPSRFLEQARRHPLRTAVSSGDVRWTYGELAARVDGVAEGIRRLASGGASRIALLCAHDAPMIAAMLGVLSAGHAYVPLDPRHPVDRLRAIIDDADLHIVAVDSGNLELASRLAPDRLRLLEIDGARTHAAPHSAARSWAVPPDAPAYILYTSGSTGRPKGVVQNHRNVLHHARVYANSIGIASTDRVALIASYGFDAAVMDIYGALLNGAALHVFDFRGGGPSALADWIRADGITVYHSTPTVYREIVGDAPAASFPSVRTVVLGGEEVRPDDLVAFRRCCPADALLVNGFGPTESTTALQYFLEPGTPLPSRTVPVGHPVDDTDVLLVNDSGEEVDVLAVGSIVIRSPHVALGYWRRPERTRAAFRPSPLAPGVRTYDTGDLGRRLLDGSIEFVGRRDLQIKVRGQRVEIGEIEMLLLEHPAVRAAVVTSVTMPSGSPALAAYVVSREGVACMTGDLRAFLRGRLPDYMVPTVVLSVDALPLTSTGKVDRHRLPPPQRPLPSVEPTVAPRTDLESMLARMFADVLGVPQVGVGDDFFELGGHSLLAMQCLARIRAALRVEVPLREIFDHPTVMALSGYIGRLRADDGDRAMPIARVARNHSVRREGAW